MAGLNTSLSKHNEVQTNCLSSSTCGGGFSTANSSIPGFRTVDQVCVVVVAAAAAVVVVVVVVVFD